MKAKDSETKIKTKKQLIEFLEREIKEKKQECFRISDEILEEEVRLLCLQVREKVYGLVGDQTMPGNFFAANPKYDALVKAVEIVIGSTEIGEWKKEEDDKEETDG